MTDEPLDELEEQDEDDHSAEMITKALRATAIVVLFATVALVGAFTLLMNRPEVIDEEPQEVALPEKREAPVVGPPELPFVDIAQSAGIDFVHINLASGEKLLPETMGGGCAFLDYDNDNDQDLLLIDSNRWPWGEPAKASSLRLYANDGAGNFIEVTQEVGLATQCYGMGIATGDYDNDGYVDLFVTAVGKNCLLRNEGGTFVDVTDSAGVSGADDAWSTSCGWFDYDRDGDLDLIVGNYVEWSPEIDKAQDFTLAGIGRAYGPPFSFGGTFPYLYQNQGDGTFIDVTESAGLQVKNPSTGVPLAKTLGVRPIDINDDGWLDLVLANDTVQNLVFLNNQDGSFEEIGALAGVAFDSAGKARGAMGIDAARFRADDSLGIAIANFANEMTALYVSNDKGQVFIDDAIPTGIGPLTRGDLSFGLFFFDADLDGRLDLFAANGHLEGEINRFQTSQHYRQAPRLFWNAGPNSRDEFVRVSSDTDLGKEVVGRGAAYADIDSDGDLDVLITQISGPVTLLRNDQASGNHYLRFKLVGTNCDRDAIGAEVEVTFNGMTIRRDVMPARSYLSQVELPITIGLGSSESVDEVVVRWLDGSEQKVENVVIDGLTVITQTEI